MTTTIGKQAEDFVTKYLVQKGFVIVAKNVTYSFGEIDMVAEDRDTLVFVEVKYRKNMDFGDPFEAVTLAKQKKIIRAAQAFLQKYTNEPICRFDVISLSGDLHAPIVEHICDAFCVEDMR